MLRFKFQLVLAVVLLAATSTFYTVSGVSVQAEDADEQPVHAQSSSAAQLRTFLRANVSLFGQTLLWSGAYGTLETQCWVEPCDSNVWWE